MLSVFIQMILVLFGVGVFAFMLWEPHVEGRNANATLFQIYFEDPFLAFAYVASIPFFVALYHVFKVVGAAGRNALKSALAVKSFRTIRFCAIALIGFVAAGEGIILTSESDDPAGGVFMGVLVALGSILVGLVAARFERRYGG